MRIAYFKRHFQTLWPDSDKLNSRVDILESLANVLDLVDLASINDNDNSWIKATNAHIATSRLG